MRAARGFILVNALLLVAALAAVAVFLLARAEGARARRAEASQAAQLVLYLDSFEALGLTLLHADQNRGPIDHLGEAWAQADYNVEVDRGRVAGSFTDLQGLFNVNWLSNPDDIAAREAFDRLILRLGLPPQSADAITRFVSPDGPGNAQAFARAQPPIKPVGGPVIFVDQLRAVPGLRDRDFATLLPYLAALPGDKALNVNTVPAVVIQSLLPAANPAALDQLLQVRLRDPFISVDDFMLRLGAALGPAAIADIDDTRFGVASDWFRADIAAQLGDRVARRRTVFERLPLPHGTRVAYRLELRE